jgi:hypothetical protein
MKTVEPFARLSVASLVNLVDIALSRSSPPFPLAKCADPSPPAAAAFAIFVTKSSHACEFDMHQSPVAGPNLVSKVMDNQSEIFNVDNSERN